MLAVLVFALLATALVASACSGEGTTTTQAVTTSEAVTTTQAVTTTRATTTTTQVVTGTLVWKFQTGGPVWATPAVSDGVVYFGSYDRYLYAVDAGDGKEKWEFKTGGYVLSSPKRIKTAETCRRSVVPYL